MPASKHVQVIRLAIFNSELHKMRSLFKHINIQTVKVNWETDVVRLLVQ